jgi:hypothetical protein
MGEHGHGWISGPWVRRIVAGIASIVPEQIADRLGIGVANVNAACAVEVSGIGGVLLRGNVGGVPISGAGVRCMWIPAKPAFRAGEVIGTRWNDAEVGAYSVACGYNTKASGQAATSFGDGGEAGGQSSFVAGEASIASAHAAAALGLSTAADADFALALGAYSRASRIAEVALSGGKVSESGDTVDMAKDLRGFRTIGTDPVEFTSDANAPAGATLETSNRFIFKQYTSTYLHGRVIARDENGDSCAWKFDVAVRRDVLAATTALIGGVAVVPTVIAQDAGWDVATLLTVQVDAVNGSLQVILSAGEFALVAECSLHGVAVSYQG